MNTGSDLLTKVFWYLFLIEVPYLLIYMKSGSWKKYKWFYNIIF